MKTTKILSLIAFLFCFTLNLRAQSGTCGANLTWELTDSTLTISGLGAMDNSHPWSSYSSQIARVSLPEGLTNICDDAFYACPNLQSIVIPNTVTSIGRQAFINCTSLKQVTLSNAVETIGHSAFSSTSITSITLPSSVTSIEDYAFSYCRKLTEITIPGSVSSIGNYAFQYCEQLSKATIEEGVKSIGYSVFQNCSKMTDISLPSSLISIGSSAFSSCSALASVVIPEQITTIEASTFSGCSSLKEVTLPDNLQTIGDNAFNGCGFALIDIPHSVASLGYATFSGCDNLTSVTLPNSITNIPRKAFSSCKKLTSVTIPEGVITIGRSAFSYCNLLNLSLPNSLQTIENGAEYSDNGAFEGNKNLTEVTIPDNVTALGAYTFEGCTALSRVTLPDGLLSIGACTFQNCTSLKSITFGADLLTIGENAFENCSALSSVAIPDKVSIIPEYAFYNCSVLSQVSLPKQLATIEVAAFMNCKSLSSIILPEGLTTIEGAAFYDCNLTNLLLPQSLRTIGEGVVTVGATTSDYHGAFEKNSNLTTITIPQSVTTLGSDAFAECAALSQVTLSEGLTTIGARAFYNCSALKTIQLPKSINSLVSAFSHCGLEEIEIPENVLILDGTFYECNKLTKVILPSSLTTIDDNSFYNCTSLTSITLSQTVRFIGSSAFYGCKSLSQINLPQEITTIEGGAFERCSALREVTIPNKITKIASSTFANCGSLVSIFLPRNISTIESYAFEYCTSLTELVLPDSLKSIGNYSCFRGCSALRSLTIPSSVTTLGSGLFEGCVSLSSVTMLPPTPPTTDYTFRYAPSTLKINLVCGSKEAYMADANWAALTYPINEISSNILTIKSNDNRMGEAYIPTPNTCDNDTAIIEALPREGYQFAAWHDGNTDNPRTIIVTQDTTYIANFEPLTTYQLTVNYDPKQGHISGTGEYYPNEEATLMVTPLGGYRFSKWGDGNTDNPRTIVMTQDTTLEALFITGDYCGDDILYTFLNDTLALNGTGDMWNLSQYGWNMYADEILALTLSDGITSLGTNAFMDLMFLSEVTIPASVKTIHKRAFENCRSLSSVMFAPNSQLQTIDHWAFYECINLKALEIPEGVTTIGNGAFYGCAYLDSIVLPASMMSIADNGFAQCTKLSAMTVHAVTPPEVDNKTFENVRRSIPVYVPFGTGATYRATPIWQEFNIQEMEAESNDNKIFYTSTDGNIVTPYDETGFGANIISNTYENGQGIITFDGPVTDLGNWAFSDCSSLASIIIPNSVTSIGYLVFNGCSSLNAIFIPENVAFIGNSFLWSSSVASIVVDKNNAIYDSRDNCNAIVETTTNTLIAGCKNTIIPNSVTSIGEAAFALCDSLFSIDIPSSIVTIGEHAFANCDSLRSVYLTEGLQSILGGAFIECDALSSINIPNSVTTIGEGTFSSCVSLTSITIGDGVSSIGYSMFSGCTSLTSVTIGNNVTSIGEEAFYFCTSLTSIIIPNTVTNVGGGAFTDCSSLTSVTIGSSVTDIEGGAFDLCYNLDTIYCYAITPPELFDEGVFQNYDAILYVPCESLEAYKADAIWGKFNNIQCIQEAHNDNKIFYTSTDGNIVTPYDETGFGANIISNTYENGQGIITFDGPVTDLGNWAFSDCSSLASIIIPNSVTSIGYLVFNGCSSLNAIFIPENVAFIGNSFLWSSSVASIVVDKNNAIYDSRDNCNAIVETTTNTLIAGCKNTIIPNSVTSIGESAFAGCDSLFSIDIPNSVLTIGNFAFIACDSLVSVNLTEGIRSIEDEVFHGCQSLFSIVIPNSVTTIGSTAFAECKSLTSVSIGNGVTTIEEYTFLNCSSLSSITIGENVTMIGENAFESCSSLVSVTIPNSVTNIAPMAFAECQSLTFITIGSSVTNIEYGAFESCYNLDTIYCYAITPPDLFDEEVFPNYDATLYVPCEALDAYKADSIWGKFSNIQCIDSENPPCEEVSVEFNATFCGSFVWNGVICTEAGDYVQTIRKTDGCDSIVTMHLVEDCPISPIDPCEDIIELDWRNALPLSQLSLGWCKLYVGDIHANQSDITSLLINDLDCPATITRAFYAHCEDEEPLFEGSATYELGATQQTMTYADFANIVPAHAEFLYLNIESIFEDCTPPCEDVHAEEYATICYGETYIWNGQTYATEGAYTMTFYTNAGCDSTVTLYLTVLPATIIVEESVVINEEYLPYTWRDLQCYDTGTYTISTPFADYPYCDSVIYVLNLTVDAPNKCGDHLYWHYSNNTMTITGYGAMYDDPDLLSYRTQDWYPTRVTHVSLSNEITHIGDVVFADCANLTNIDIPTSVTSIGDGAFSWTGLQSITIPASVTELGEQVFEACNDLHTILYEGNPIAINNQTVHPLIGCVHLDTVITPAALWHCTAADPALEARYGVPHKAHYIEVTDGELTDQAVKYIAQNATTLEILDLTNATNTTLPYGAWSNCYQLTQLYLPEVIETLPESMIEGGCRLLEIAIPATVTEIGNYAFAGCVNVWRMTVDAVIPPKVYENTFDGISRSISVQVPAGSEELYREAEYWREFFVETDAQQSPQKAQKILHEDQILILRNGKVYTTMGQLITNE